MRGGIMFILGGRPQGSAGSQLDFTPRTRLVLAIAGEEAHRVGEPAISPHHLLVAILREGQGIAAQLLQISGVRLEQVGETVHISVIPETEEGPITLPTDFQEALQQHRPYLRSCLTPRKRGLSTGLSKPKGEPREASKWKKPSSNFNGSAKRTSSSVNAIHPFCEQI